jgi:hypothetical protein
VLGDPVLNASRLDVAVESIEISMEGIAVIPGLLVLVLVVGSSVPGLVLASKNEETSIVGTAVLRGLSELMNVVGASESKAT